MFPGATHIVTNYTLGASTISPRVTVLSSLLSRTVFCARTTTVNLFNQQMDDFFKERTATNDTSLYFR